MRRRNILIGTLALVVVLATIGGVAYALHTRPQADGSSYPGLHLPVSVVCPGPTYGLTDRGGPGDGLPIIRPRNDCTPSFTQQDVRDYVAHGRIFLGGGIGPSGGLYSWLLPTSSARRATKTWYMLVCYIGLSGKFIFAGGIDPPESLSAVSVVFDAHTGNELVSTTYAPLG
jgi:hypothetical protein